MVTEALHVDTTQPSSVDRKSGEEKPITITSPQFPDKVRGLTAQFSELRKTPQITLSIKMAVATGDVQVNMLGRLSVQLTENLLKIQVCNQILEIILNLTQI